MAGGPALNLSACCARSRFRQVTCGKSARASPTAATIATPITAIAPSGFSNARQRHPQGHHDAVAAKEAAGGKEMAMRAHNANRKRPVEVDSEFAGVDPMLPTQGATPPARRGQNEVARLLADVDGVPVLVRFLVGDISA